MNDVNIVYVHRNQLKIFIVKTQRSMTLYPNQEGIAITAICHNQQRNTVISFGMANGRIHDLDLTKKRVVRTSNLHRGQKVTAITSRGRHLVSSSADGRTIVFDQAKMEVERELELAVIGINVPTDLLLMEDENTLVVADSKGLNPIDISESSACEDCLQQGKLN